jgi:transposase
LPSLPIALCSSCPTSDNALGHRCTVYPSSSVTDAQWALLEPLLPPPGNTEGRGGRPEKYCRRMILDAIFYVVRGGIAWRQLPSEFPPATTVWAIFARWVRAGVWQRIHDTLRDRTRVRDGRNPLPSAAIIDSQSVQGADTVPRSSRGYDAARRPTAANGTSRSTPTDCCSRSR